MSLVGLLVTVLILAVLVWAVRTLLPMLGLPPQIQRVIEVVLVVIVVLWLLGALVGYSPVIQIR